MAIDDVCSRVAEVGGIPRAVFDQSTFTHRQGIINDDVKVHEHTKELYDALLHDHDCSKMVRSPPQAFLGYYSKYPFTNIDHDHPSNYWVDFLSQSVLLKVGQHVYNMMRASICSHDDHSSAGMFFERWVGTFLSSGASSVVTNCFSLREFVNGSMTPTELQLMDQ